MIKRYPWHGTSISKGDHFDFVWQGFVNNCYCFEERMKQMGLHLNELVSLNNGKKVEISKWLKAVKKELGEYIKFRGMHVHQWPRSHQSYQMFSSVDFLSNHTTTYDEILRGFYFETKREIIFEMKNARTKMVEILKTSKPDPILYVIAYSKSFSEYLEEYQIC